MIIHFGVFLCDFLNLDSPKLVSRLFGSQCSGDRSECPWDSCNGAGCTSGCVSRACTEMACLDNLKKEEKQLCSVKNNNCKDGLECIETDDLCKNGVGRCRKAGMIEIISKSQIYLSLMI